MGEVIHLSYGPQANYLNASFYNLQESYFVYTTEQAALSHVNPRVRFSYGKAFTPRAVFWDFRHGFGSWHRFLEKYEEPQDQESITLAQGRPVSTVDARQARRSWTDGLRVPVHPSTLHEIPGWEFDEEKYPFGRQRGAPLGQDVEFSLFAEGSEQFDEVSKQDGGAEDYLDTTFRPTLEKCDSIGGVNVVTDFGGWSGFTAAYLEPLRDEFIPKAPLFTWPISRYYESPRLNAALRQSRLEALATLSEFSSLVIPLQDELKTDFEDNASRHLKTFETLCLMSSLRQNPISMYQLCEELTFGVPRANIIQAGRTMGELDAEPRHVRNLLTIVRGAERPTGATGATQNIDGIDVRSDHWCPQPYKQERKAVARYELNDNPLQLRKQVKFGRHELKELIYDLTDDYIWHWQSESDDDDF